MNNGAFWFFARLPGLDFIDPVEASIKSTVSPSPHSITLAGDDRNPDDQDSPPDRTATHVRQRKKLSHRRLAA
jgi:hypothetical protein